MKKITCVFCVLWAIFGLQSGYAQVTDSPGQFSVGLQAGISHSGWNLALVGQYEWSEFAAYAGPSISLNRGLPGPGPIGLNTGFDWRIPTQKSNLTSVVNFDYQLHFFQLQAANTDIIQEFHLSYGLMLNISDEWFLIQQLGYGLYLDHSYIESLGRRKTSQGYNGLVKLRAGYRF